MTFDDLKSLRAEKEKAYELMTNAPRGNPDDDVRFDMLEMSFFDKAQKYREALTAYMERADV